MWRSEQPPAGSGSPGCPDLLRHVGGPRSPLSPLYLSFFEEECRAIAARLRLGAAAAAEPSPGPAEGSALWPDAAGPVTSTPLQDSPPRNEGALGGATPAARPSTGGCEAVAAAGLARGEPRRLPLPAAGGCPGAAPPGSRLARPQALCPKAARRGAAQPRCGGPGPAGRPRPPALSPGRGGGRLALSRAGASLGPELPKAGKGLGAPGTRLPQPPGSKLKLVPAAKSRLQHPSGASQPAQPCAVPRRTPRDTEMKTAVKVGGRRQPSQRLSTAVPTVASRSRLRPLGRVASPKRFCLGSTTLELVCNTTRELMCNTTRELTCNTTRELKENGKADQTWVCVGSSFSSELAPGPTPGLGFAVPAEESAGDQLSQELKRVKSELERAKGELGMSDWLFQGLRDTRNPAEKTAQCEAYRQMISSLQAQLRAAGICPEDAAMEESGDSGRD